MPPTMFLLAAFLVGFVNSQPWFLFWIEDEFLKSVAKDWCSRGDCKSEEAEHFLQTLRNKTVLRRAYPSHNAAVSEMAKLLPLAKELGFQKLSKNILDLLDIITDKRVFVLTYDTIAMVNDYHNHSKYTLRTDVNGIIEKLTNDMIDLFLATRSFNFRREKNPEKQYSKMIKHALKHGELNEFTTRFLKALVSYRFRDGLKTKAEIVDALQEFRIKDEYFNYKYMDLNKYANDFVSDYLGSIFHEGGPKLAYKTYNIKEEIWKAYFKKFLESGKCPNYSVNILKNIVEYLSNFLE